MKIRQGITMTDECTVNQAKFYGNVNMNVNIVWFILISVNMWLSLAYGLQIFVLTVGLQNRNVVLEAWISLVVGKSFITEFIYLHLCI